MSYVTLLMTVQYKTRTVVGRLHLHKSMFNTQSIMLNLHFIPQSVFYTQSVVQSRQSIVQLQSIFYTDWKPTIPDCVNQHKYYLFRQYVRGHAFITKTTCKTMILFTITTWIAFKLALRKQLLSIFTSETKKRRTCWCTKVILWELSSFRRVYVAYVQRNLGQRSEKFTSQR